MLLTDVTLNVYIVKDNNKFDKKFFRDTLNPLMPKIPKWLDMFSKSYSK